MAAAEVDRNGAYMKTRTMIKGLTVVQVIEGSGFEAKYMYIAFGDLIPLGKASANRFILKPCNVSPKVAMHRVYI